MQYPTVALLSGARSHAPPLGAGGESSGPRLGKNIQLKGGTALSFTLICSIFAGLPFMHGFSLDPGGFVHIMTFVVSALSSSVYPNWRACSTS
jgi:hypothetical protein